MHKLLGYVCDELEELERKVDKSGKLSMSELQYVDLLAHTKKDLLTSKAMEESGYSREGGYSGKRDSMGRYMDAGPNNGGMSNNGGSYARYNDGESYARYNDGMEQSGGYSSRRYSRDEGKANMISQLQQMMGDAPSQDEREVLQEAMRKLKQM